MSQSRTRSWQEAIARRLKRIAQRRPPDFVIGGQKQAVTSSGIVSVEDPYLKRWWLTPRNRFLNVYLHHFLRSDDDRALHDHPWWNVSLLLEGEYTEHTIAAGGVNSRVVYRAGYLKARGASYAHRIELHAGPCWTLFITGPRMRSWGFHCPHGWRHWRDFTSKTDSGQVGRGCE